MLTTEDVKEYQVIFKKVYGEDITFEQAMEQGARLLNFFKVITRPEIVRSSISKEVKLNVNK